MSANRQLAFLDTNIMVYAHDARDMAKHTQARKLLSQGIADMSTVISSQVIQEFCNVLLKPGGDSWSIEALNQILQTAFTPIQQPLTMDGNFYSRGLALYERHSLSWYDALIVQAALDLGCETLYSEDLQAGQQFGKLTVVNPFS